MTGAGMPDITFHFKMGISGNSIQVRIRVNKGQAVFVRLISDQSVNCF